MYIIYILFIYYLFILYIYIILYIILNIDIKWQVNYEKYNALCMRRLRIYYKYYFMEIY